MRDHHSLSGGPSGPGAHSSQSDPRLSTLTLDAADERSSVFGRSNRGQSEFGRIGEKVTPIVQELPGDAAHPAGDDGDGGVGLLAAAAVPLVDVAEVAGAADGHPGGLDEGPLEPAVGEGHHAAVAGLAPGAVGGGHQAGVATELVGPGESRDAVDLRRHHGGEDRADAGQGLEPGGGGIVRVGGADLAFELLDDGAELLERGEILLEQGGVGRGQVQGAQPMQALLAELIAEDRPGQVPLPGDEGMHAVADHRAHAGEEEPLADDVLARAVGRIGRMHGGQQVAAQERGERTGVEPVGLDLRVGDEPGLERMRQHHVRDTVDLAELVVEPAPIPAGLHDDAAGFGQGMEVGGKSRRIVVVNAGLAEARASGVLGGHHGVAFMVVDSGVEHRASTVAHGYRTPFMLPDPVDL